MVRSAKQIKEGENGYCPKCNGGELSYQSERAQSGRKRYRCMSCRARTTSPLPTPALPEQEVKSKLPEAKCYIFTSAQNATPVHKGFLASLLAYAEHMGAELVVSGYRYKNPTSVWTVSQTLNERWAEEIEPYLYQTRQTMNANIEFVGDAFPQATAVRPLMGFEALTGDRSCIIPHPKVQLRTVATPAHRYPKIITTTGAVTVPNYSPTRAGKLGAFHHQLGAVIVEIGEEDRFALRQISAQANGAFYDINSDGVCKVQGEKITYGHRLATLVQGDSHVDVIDPDVVRATFEDDYAIVKLGNPRHLVWHDLIDLASRSRWATDPFEEVGKMRTGHNSVRDELVRGWEFHDEMAKDRSSIIIPSNHTDSRLKWYMRETDWRKDPVNAEFYLETALQMVRSLEQTEIGPSYDDPFIHWGRKLSKAPNVRFPDRDQSVMIAGIEHQYHGDVGPGAARSASLTNMRRIGVRTSFGHTHEPGTEEGAMTAGTSTYLRLGYNTGPSSWMNSHIATFPNGKRTHLFIMGGEWVYV